MTADPKYPQHPQYPQCASAWPTQVKDQTSTWPFAAILDGRQQLPPDYWMEFARGPYLVIVVGTVGAYFAHPLMQLGSYNLHW